MKNMGMFLIDPNPQEEIVMGNTALVRAMIESGVQVVTSYPGSPTPEIASAIFSMPHDKKPFYFEFSTNEKVATEVAFGASVNGHLSTVFFKSVGLNVAADSFVQLSHMELIGGMVIILGDDPGANSSQNEQDNRHLARLCYTPIFEPANPQEAYDMFCEAARVSQLYKMPIILRLTTHVCHGKQKVAFRGLPSLAVDRTPRFDPKNGPYIPITKSVYPMKRHALEKLRTIAAYADSRTDTYKTNNSTKKGIITAGLPFLSLQDVVHTHTISIDIMKLDIVYPLPRKKISDFLRSHEEIKILEELDDVLERDIKTIAFEEGLTCRIIGKQSTEDWIGEYTAEKVQSVLHHTWPDSIPKVDFVPHRQIAPRPAQMCPGCGHRSAFFAIKKALKGSEITVADIGCHTLGFLEPYSIGQVLLCMGHSCGTAAGLSLFNTTRRVIAFLGDSTFFHAGLPGIVNAVFNKHNFTLIVMENGTTAMTGHQNHPGTGHNANEIVDAIPIRRVLEGLGVTSIREADTYSQSKVTQLLQEAMAENGFNVIIARHPCMLKYMREQARKPDFKRRHVVIDQTTCDKTHVCIESFACPTFQRQDDGAVVVNNDLCIGDGSCIQTCPVKAIKPQK